MSQYDTLIAGGRYFDGSQNPSRIADVGIRDGRIHTVADIFTRVETVPREKVLPILEEYKTWQSPEEWVGFIDAHPIGPNVISFLGHSDLHTGMMGLHRATDRSASTDF